MLIFRKSFWLVLIDPRSLVSRGSANKEQSIRSTIYRVLHEYAGKDYILVSISEQNDHGMGS